MVRRKDLLRKIEAHKRAYYEHIEKAKRYHGDDSTFALKTAERIKEQIIDLCKKAGVEPNL